MTARMSRNLSTYVDGRGQSAVRLLVDIAQLLDKRIRALGLACGDLGGPPRLVSVLRRSLRAQLLDADAIQGRCLQPDGAKACRLQPISDSGAALAPIASRGAGATVKAHIGMRVFLRAL